MNYTLSELLNIPRLQELLSSLDEVHSMPSAIIDTEGNILTATAWQDICTKFHRVNPDTEKKCIESDRHIECMLGESIPHVVYRCPMGLVDSATPIIIEEKHLGNVFTGQLFMEPPDPAYFIEQAHQYGFDESEYLEAMRKVPIFSEEELHKNLAFIGKLAQMLAEQGLQSKRQREAEEQIKCHNAQLQTTFMQTVKLATTLSEIRDPYTVGHERRVAEIAVAIGAEMGLGAMQLEGLKVGGYLHDVGKTSIPAEILTKPGKLNPIEHQLIKAHSQHGYEVLKDMDFPWPVAQIALQHHERLDGSGYPHGLKGEEILLEACIIAVADVVEAMASHRPYRPGLGIEAALCEIERGRGSVYDPVVADACLRLFREKGYELLS